MTDDGPTGDPKADQLLRAMSSIRLETPADPDVRVAARIDRALLDRRDHTEAVAVAGYQVLTEAPPASGERLVLGVSSDPGRDTGGELVIALANAKISEDQAVFAVSGGAVTVLGRLPAGLCRPDGAGDRLLDAVPARHYTAYLDADTVHPVHRPPKNG
jgi:hypothetical protein